MREILFRGKAINLYNGSKDFVFGQYVQNRNGCFIYSDTWQNGIEKHQVIIKTVGQYTGLTDKNGTKIFEGDIVKFGKYTYQITFECGSFALLDKQGLMIAKIGGMNDHCYSLMNLYLECCWEEDCAYDIEVIGNIHDNPELLKELGK